MEPRQLRLPGFTRLWASEFVGSQPHRIRICQRQSLGPIRERIFVPVRAVEQQHLLATAHQSTFERLVPGREYRAAFRTKKEAIVARGVLDTLQNCLFGYGDRCPATFTHCAQNEEIA